MHRPNCLINAIALLTLFVASGCGLHFSKEARYLSSATDQATEEQVRERLGAPLKMSTNQSGNDVWMYQVREGVREGNDSYVAPTVQWCDDYTLTFDGKGILRHWGSRSQKCIDAAPQSTGQPAGS